MIQSFHHFFRPGRFYTDHHPVRPHKIVYRIPFF